jgi:GGDEF domain-containing protein
MRKQKRKTFQVDWIKHARGRQAVQEFALLVRSLTQEYDKALRLGDLELAFGADGNSVNIGLRFGDDNKPSDMAGYEATMDSIVDKKESRQGPL